MNKSEIIRVGHSEFSQSEQSCAAWFQKPKADAQIGGASGNQAGKCRPIPDQYLDWRMDILFSKQHEDISND